MSETTQNTLQQINLAYDALSGNIQSILGSYFNNFLTDYVAADSLINNKKAIENLMQNIDSYLANNQVTSTDYVNLLDFFTKLGIIYFNFADQGFPGDEGYNSLPGRIGSSGVMGDDGDKGDPGFKGSKGKRGRRGEDGDQGDDGDDGDKGKKGLKGKPGKQGEQGDQGDQGDAGDDGEDGDRGFKGALGTYGDINKAPDASIPLSLFNLGIGTLNTNLIPNDLSEYVQVSDVNKLQSSLVDFTNNYVTTDSFNNIMNSYVSVNNFYSNLGTNYFQVGVLVPTSSLIEASNIVDQAVQSSLIDPVVLFNNYNDYTIDYSNYISNNNFVFSNSFNHDLYQCSDSIGSSYKLISSGGYTPNDISLAIQKCANWAFNTAFSSDLNGNFAAKNDQIFVNIQNIGTSPSGACKMLMQPKLKINDWSIKFYNNTLGTASEIYNLKGQTLFLENGAESFNFGLLDNLYAYSLFVIANERIYPYYDGTKLTSAEKYFTCITPHYGLRWGECNLVNNNVKPTGSDYFISSPITFETFSPAATDLMSWCMFNL